MKWIHGYSAIFFSILSLPLSVIALYSKNHFEEGNNIIVTIINDFFNLFAMNDYIPPVTKSMMAAPWYLDEYNLIFVSQIISMILSTISLIFIFISVSKKEHSIFYAIAALLTAYSIYFVNIKLSLVVIFLVFIVILQIRKKVGIST